MSVRLLLDAHNPSNRKIIDLLVDKAERIIRFEAETDAAFLAIRAHSPVPLADCGQHQICRREVTRPQPTPRFGKS